MITLKHAFPSGKKIRFFLLKLMYFVMPRLAIRRNLFPFSNDRNRVPHKVLNQFTINSELHLSEEIQKQLSNDMTHEMKKCKGVIHQSGKLDYTIYSYKNVAVLGHTGQAIDLDRNISLTKCTKFNVKLKKLHEKRIINQTDQLIVNFVNISEGFNYFHFMVERVVYMYTIIKELNKSDKRLLVLVHPTTNDLELGLRQFMESSFENVNFHVLETNTKLLCNRIITYSVVRDCNFRIPVSIEDVRIINDIFRSQYSIKQSKNTKGRRIYVSRMLASRKMINEKVLTDYLAANGFDVFCLEKISHKSQIELFSEASIVIGSHGANLTNIIFSPQKTFVIDIIPRNFCSSIFAWTSHILGHDYHYVLTGRSFANSYFRIDRNAINRIKYLVNLKLRRNE